MTKSVYLLNGTEIVVKSTFSNRLSYRSSAALNRITFNAPRGVAKKEILKKAEEYILFKRENGAFNDVKDGGYLYVLGEKKLLSIMESDKNRVTECGGEVYVEIKTYDYVNAVIEKFYKKTLENFLKTNVAKEEDRIGVKCNGWKINGMISAWGKCNTETKVLSFSVNLAIFTEETVKMVIVHELGHVLYPNHGKEFHSFMKKYCPKYKEILAKIQK